MDFIGGDFLDDQFMTMAIRVAIILVLSGLVGFERELKNRGAGLRTHILVGVGSCILMLLSLYGFDAYLTQYEIIRFDPARIPSYVISGIGFLGAGTIIINGRTIKGLTTAASIWVVAGLGLIVGAGMYKLAILTTVVILLTLSLLNKIEKGIENGKKGSRLNILIDPKLHIGDLLRVFDQFDITITKMDFDKGVGGNEYVIVEIKDIKNWEELQLRNAISMLTHVTYVS